MKGIQKIQKYAFYGSLLGVALLFLYSLMCGSPAYCIYFYEPYIDKASGLNVTEFIDMFNVFNINVLYYAIAGFICFAILAIYSQGTRKKFYLSNFIVPFIFTAYTVFILLNVVPNVLYFGEFYTLAHAAINFDKVPSYVRSTWLPGDALLIYVGLLPVILLTISSIGLVYVTISKLIKQRRVAKEVK